MATLPPDKVKVSPAIVSIVALACGLTLIAANGLYLFLGVLTFSIIVVLLWKNASPGILIFSILIQWTQVIAFPIWIENLGTNINHFGPHGGIAVICGYLGLIVIAIVFYLRLRKLPLPSREQLVQQVKLFNEKKIFQLYLFSTLFLSGIGAAFSIGGGLKQIFMTLSSVKWVFFMVYAYVVWINKKNRLILFLMILFEFVTSLYSYFSTFREVIFFTIIVSLTFIRKINFKQLFYGLLVGGALIFFFLTWTAVKSDYRQFLNRGTRQQVVEVSRSEAFSKLQEKVSALTWQDYQNILVLFFYRLQYILHLSRTMDRVPAVLPHEYGQLWWENISFVLTPRLLFPNKPIYEATIKTNKYTGYHYTGFKKGTSFSLGYFADTYIDFGYFGMFVFLAVYALFVMFIYNSFFKIFELNVILRYAVINVSLINLASFEADGLFVFGRLLLLFLVFWFLSKFVFLRLQKWLYKSRVS